MPHTLLVPYPRRVISCESPALSLPVSLISSCSYGTRTRRRTSPRNDETSTEQIFDLHISSIWVATKFPDLSNVARLGQGGQKVVHSADHAHDGAVVLKLIKPNQDAARIAREVLAGKQARCARIPEILRLDLTAT